MSLRVFLALVVFIALGVWQFLEPRPLDGRTLLSIVLGGYIGLRTLKEQQL